MNNSNQPIKLPSKVLFTLKYSENASIRTGRTGHSNSLSTREEILSPNNDNTDEEITRICLNDFQSPVLPVLSPNSKENVLACESDSKTPVLPVLKENESSNRFRRVPSVTMPLTDAIIQIPPPKAIDLIRGFTTRQPASVQAWISTQANAYHVMNGWNDERSFVAAALDLIVWQWRLEHKPRIDAIKDIVVRLEAFEEVFGKHSRKEEEHGSSKL